MKILENNKVLQTPFSGMALNYLNAEYQNGYIRDVYNECKIVMNSSNSITVSTGMIVVEGIRLLFDEAETFNITSFPDSSLLHHLVLKVTATTEGENKAEIINRINEPLRQDEVLKTGSGVYELELASYLLSPNGISNFAQTLLPIILTNEELQSFKEMIDELDKKVDALDQVIITANEDAERALTTVKNFTVGTVQKGVDPVASIDVDVIKKTAKLNLTLPKGDKGDNGTVITIDGEPQDYFKGNVINNITNESKNLFYSVNKKITTNSRTFTFSDSGDNFKATGTATTENSVYLVNGVRYARYFQSATITKENSIKLENKKYTVSYSSEISNLILIIGTLGSVYSSYNYKYTYELTPTKNSYTFDLSNYTDENYICFVVYDGASSTDKIISNIQLEEGDTRTEYYPRNPNRHITNSEAEFLKESFESQVNLFNEEEASPIWLGGDGESGSSDVTITSDFIKVKPNTLYSISSNNTAAANRGICYYNQNRNFISGVLWDAIKTTITTPASCEYIRISFAKGYDSMFNEGEPLPYRPYNSAAHITNPQAAYLKEVQEKSINLFDKNNLNFIFAYPESSNNLLVENSVNKTLYIPCEPNTAYTVSKITSAQFGLAYCTELPRAGAAVYNVTYPTHENNLSYATIVTGSSAKYLILRYVQTAQDPSSSGVTEQQILDSLQIEKGTKVTNYRNYSAHVNMGDSNSELLKSMAIKSLNLVNIADKAQSTSNGVSHKVVDGEVYKSGTCTTGFGITLPLKTNLTLKSGKTYTFINFGKSQNQEISLKNAAGTNIITLKIWKNTVTYRATSDITLTQIGYWVATSAVVSNDYFMVIEGTAVPKDFQKYQGGQYVQQSQIKNFSFDESTGTLSITDN